ncbi:MAG: SPOR domain-containing protein [Legionellales bacterium]|jgi:cell division protein FtsN|nr:SPOR domain-containing protein [Legionellales bacterium]
MKEEKGMRRGVGTGRGYKNNNAVASKSNSLSWFLFGLVLGLFSSLFLVLYFNGFEANKSLLLSTHTPVLSDLNDNYPAKKTIHLHKDSGRKSSGNLVVKPALESVNKSLSNAPVVKTPVAAKTNDAALVVNKDSALVKAKVQQHPKYEFYNALKNDSSVPVKSKYLPVSKQQSDPLVSGYYLKVASLKNEKEAEGLKAKLLLLGYSATIKKANIGSVLWSRVIIGPFDTIKEAYNKQSDMRGDNLNAVLVKSDAI